MKRLLLLEDGSVFEGEAFGADVETSGEIVFSTGMTGYQESITDQSYNGQIITFTYPLIGNYGINRDDYESIRPTCKGVVVYEWAEYPSNWRQQMTLDEFLKLKGIPGISGIDTRALTKIIRKHGTMKACLINEGNSIHEALENLQKSVLLNNQIEQVSTKLAYASPGVGKNIVLVDFGLKHSILRELSQRQCHITVVPHTTTAQEILNLNPDGVLLSNGPGNPEQLPNALQMIQEIQSKIPIFGICMGHQLFAKANGAKTYKMTFGHRGFNHAVRHLQTGRVDFTSQNHGYAVSREDFPEDLFITHEEINDKTVEGVRHKYYPAFSVQFHPDAAPGFTATTEEEAVNAAQKIGYPVLVRPSYVLGGRAMKIVENEEDLRHYMTTAVKASPDHPVLIDAYLIGKECEVDAISDGQNILIPGIMEHIERAGVHSGDSMAVYPPQTLSETIIETIVDYTKRLAIGLNCIGMMNIQFVIKDQKVYVIEVNPRASRTLPFLSKVTHIPMAQVATKVILGDKLCNFTYGYDLYPASDMVHIKAPVFSFTKLAKVDSLLGPEMKSTGEVMGSDINLQKALYKAFEAAYLHMPDYGNIVFTVDDTDKEEALELAKVYQSIGYRIYATQGTAIYFDANGLETVLVGKLGENDRNHIPDLIKNGKIQAVINTVGQNNIDNHDALIIRRSAIEQGVPLFTSLDTAHAMFKVLESRAFTLKVLD
ncbi:TPA: carbamoyl phosphate synthase small subunit [Streptococcus agalactiae]